jgi:hypothetical protein
MIEGGVEYADSRMVSFCHFIHLFLSPTQIKANSYHGQNNTHFLPIIKALDSMAHFKNTSVLE